MKKDILLDLFYPLRIWLAVVFVVNGQAVIAQHNHQGMGTSAAAPVATEKDYYRIETVNMPENVLPEVGGLASMEDGSIAFVTRRGELLIVHNPEGGRPYTTLYASGLHEPLGLHYQNGSFYVAQRAELTKITDVDGDGKADRFETITNWPLSGNYCEYNHGPVLANDGNFYINFNLADNGMGPGREEPFYGEMGSHALWRGWVMQVTPDGKLSPYAAGLRSPAGLGVNAQGELFYTENQGGWVGTGYIAHVEKGDFFGHPSSLKSAILPGSPVHLTSADIPKDDPLFHDAVRKVKGMKMPSVRIPHGILGKSTAGFVADKDGYFGPFFKDQLFVGDEGMSNIVRVAMEKVNGAYQGVVFPFREGFVSGILRMKWGAGGALFVGMSDRGWSSSGKERQGLERLVWTGKTPFEMKTVKAKSDGFEITFTLPVDADRAVNPESYTINSFDYRYHQQYGSNIEDLKPARITGIRLSEDRLSVRLVLDEMRAGYIYELRCEGLRQQHEGAPLLHPFGFYSLNSVPAGQYVDSADPLLIPVSEKNKAETVEDEAQKSKINSNTGRNNKRVENAKPAPAGKRIITMPPSWASGPDQTITIGTLPDLQFNIKQLDVKPGAKIKLVFSNSDDMPHNLLIVRGGATNEIGESATALGLKGPNMQYVPVSDKVLYHTNLLQPHTVETIYFVAPGRPGRYEYLCTYPGHYQTMRGILNVKE